MGELSGTERFWLKAFPRGALAIGGAVAACIVSATAIGAYQCIQVASIRADIVQSIVDGAVTVVQTVVGGFTQ